MRSDGKRKAAGAPLPEEDAEYEACWRRVGWKLFCCVKNIYIYILFVASLRGGFKGEPTEIQPL